MLRNNFEDFYSTGNIFHCCTYTSAPTRLMWNVTNFLYMRSKGEVNAIVDVFCDFFSNRTSLKSQDTEIIFIRRTNIEKWSSGRDLSEMHCLDLQVCINPVASFMKIFGDIRCCEKCDETGVSTYFRDNEMLTIFFLINLFCDKIGEELSFVFLFFSLLQRLVTHQKPKTSRLHRFFGYYKMTGVLLILV